MATKGSSAFPKAPALWNLTMRLFSVIFSMSDSSKLVFVMGVRWLYNCCFVGCFILSVSLTFIWPITYQFLSMPLPVTCWCHSRLMRRCFWGRWTCPIVSEDHPLEMSPLWLKHKYSFFFVCIDLGTLYHLLLVPDYVAGIRFEWMKLLEAQFYRRSPRP